MELVGVEWPVNDPREPDSAKSVNDVRMAAAA